jgi:glucosamine-6-phosphate deaminase
MMVVVVRRSAAAAAADAARLVADAVRRKPAAVLGLPTGKTAVPFYAALVGLHRRGAVSFERTTTFNLDEFLGLGPDVPQSFQAFLRRHFFRRVDLEASRQHALDGTAASWRREVVRYERAIQAVKGLDVCILGIGRNGHVAFNEPAARLRPHTHRQQLTLATRRDTAAGFGGNLRAVPAEALTVGMGPILTAHEVVLIATGRSKAAIVDVALTGPITPRVPASLLQRHPRLTVLLDHAAAASLLRKPTSGVVLRFA